MPHETQHDEGPTQGTHTGDPHRGEGPTEDPPPEGRVTQGTNTEHTQTPSATERCRSEAGGMCCVAGRVKCTNGQGQAPHMGANGTNMVI